MTSHIDCGSTVVSRPNAARAAERAGPREWAGLALLAAPTVLLGLDLTVLHLALPALAAELQPTGTQALWIMDAYGFMIAGFLVTMGTLGDRIGRRKLLLIGASAFAIASVFATFSTTPVMLIAARAALGIAGATLMPSTLALITNLFPDPCQRALAIGIWATMFALGMAAGPVVGGLLLDLFWWGAAFLIAVPVVALLLLAGPFILPEYRAPHRGRLDLASVALSLAAMLPAIYSVKQVAKDGPTFGALAAMVTGIGFAIVFTRRQRRLVDPLLDLDLFRIRAFSLALVVLLLGLVAIGGTMLLVTQYLQLVIGFSPLVAGLWMGPPALAMVVAGVVSPMLARKIRPGHVVAGSLGLSVVGYLMIAQVDAEPSALIVVVTGFSLAYLGLGTIAALGTDLVVSSAPAQKAGSASAMSETVQDLGVSLGIAMLGSLATAIYRMDMSQRLPADLAADGGATAVDSLWSALAAEPALPSALIEQAREAFTAGLNLAALASAILVSILVVVSAAGLRGVRRLGEDH